MIQLQFLSKIIDNFFNEKTGIGVTPDWAVMGVDEPETENIVTQSELLYFMELIHDYYNGRSKEPPPEVICDPIQLIIYVDGRPFLFYSSPQERLLNLTHRFLSFSGSIQAWMRKEQRI